MASNRKWLALVLFAVLAVAHTWPLASAPGRYSRNDNMDTQLNEWTMAWVAHQVVRDPVHLFNANIFYPEKHTLAFSEHLFVQGVMAMPLYWAGVSPVAAFNIILIAGLALTGWATSIVMHRWTGHWTAAILSGCLIAFNASTLSRLVHIQAMHLEFFPFMLLALDELLNRPRAKAALQVALWFTLEALTSVYFLVFITIVAIVAALSRANEWFANRAAFLKQALVAAIAAGVLLTPFLLPYYHARQEQEAFTRPLSEVARYSAHWKNYLASAGTLHMETLGWSTGYATADYLFPGFVALLFTLIALVSLTAIKDRRARMALAFGLVCFALSFGPAFAPYEFLYKTFPLLQAIRGAARFGQMALAAIALLSGFGLAWLATKMPKRAALIVGIVAIVGANIEAWRAPIGYCGTPENKTCQEFTEIAPIFKTLDRPDVKAIIVFPWYAPGPSMNFNARYMLQSTSNWKPMMNGYSGYMPTSMFLHNRGVHDFPSESSIQYLKKLGITHALVDSRNMGEDTLKAIAASPFLTLENTDGNLQILKIK
ncbi:MAG: hypothetical protein EPO35_13185 [Acidobacteria bacterium]|nr:MAG: hypothetical protein EPO35_13185 [Acidobacteriota bacterium]